jgi:hypothetical protein
MAYIAFDLDNTLGFFELTNPLAFLWSPDFLENPEQSAPNARLELSAKLHAKLKRARQTFANNLIADPELLNLVLRPNLDVVFPPLLHAKKRGILKAVIIYSNTGVTYSMELAKHLIEKKYKSPGLISLMADHWHPLRVADRPRYVPEGRYVQPEKTIKTLQLLFRTATGQKSQVDVGKIMFMDDRDPKHKLQEQEGEGLTYIIPSAFHPRITDYHKRAILFLALEALDKCGLLSDEAYLSSGFCHRNIPYDYVKRHRVDGFPELFAYVWERIEKVESGKWAPDTIQLESKMYEYLEKVQA